METYIVQVYRRDRNGAPRGLVERTGDEGRQPFSTMEELWSALGTKAGMPGSRTSPSASGRKSDRSSGR